MKKILLLLLLLSQVIYSQDELKPRFRFVDFSKESFTFSVYVDPTSSFKEKGVDFLSEIEYTSLFYVKAGFENFSALTGGYKDFHAGIGLNFTSGYFEKFRYYLGYRQAIVWRTNQENYTGWELNPGIEGGIDYNLTDHIFTGLRFTFDKRNDQKILGWNPEIKFSGFVRLGYKWDFKGKRF